MTYVSLMLFGFGNAVAAGIIILSLLGKVAPKWSQRWGNIVVVLSILALLIKNDAPADNVWVPIFDVWSLCLGLIGAFWGALGDVVCSAIRSDKGWKQSLKEAIRE